MPTQKRLPYPYPYEPVFDAFLYVLGRLEMNVTTADRDSGVIKAKVKRKLFRDSGQVTVTMVFTDPTTTVTTIRSTSSFESPLRNATPFATNIQNIDQLSMAVGTYLKRTVPHLRRPRTD